MVYNASAGQFFQVGMVSGGVSNCGNTDIPDYYARLDHPEISSFIKNPENPETPETPETLENPKNPENPDRQQLPQPQPALSQVQGIVNTVQWTPLNGITDNGIKQINESLLGIFN
jgi:hypothetical protein